ncbi:MAG: hypothetical protein K6E51_03935 [Treponema sp.]|nr:hypothetical protein [Treponema sp.]
MMNAEDKQDILDFINSLLSSELYIRKHSANILESQSEQFSAGEKTELLTSGKVLKERFQEN